MIAWCSRATVASLKWKVVAARLSVRIVHKVSERDRRFVGNECV